jgi:hypothetical protein
MCSPPIARGRVKFVRPGVSLALRAGAPDVFINATWAADRAAGLAKAATVLGLIVAVALLASSYSLRDTAKARVLARWALVGLVCGLGFLLIELSFDGTARALLEQSTRSTLQHSPEEDQSRRRRGHQDLCFCAQSQCYKPRPVPDA